MLKVEIGYVAFVFPDEEYLIAFEFAKNAKDHMDPEEHKKVVISFEDKEDES